MKFLRLIILTVRQVHDGSGKELEACLITPSETFTYQDSELNTQALTTQPTEIPRLLTGITQLASTDEPKKVISDDGQTQLQKKYVNKLLKVYGSISFSKKFNRLQLRLIREPDVLAESDTADLVAIELDETAQVLEFRSSVLTNEWVPDPLNKKRITAREPPISLKVLDEEPGTVAGVLESQDSETGAPFLTPVEVNNGEPCSKTLSKPSEPEPLDNCEKENTGLEPSIAGIAEFQDAESDSDSESQFMTQSAGPKRALSDGSPSPLKKSKIQNKEVKEREYSPDWPSDEEESLDDLKAVTFADAQSIDQTRTQVPILTNWVKIEIPSSIPLPEDDDEADFLSSEDDELPEFVAPVVKEEPPKKIKPEPVLYLLPVPIPEDDFKVEFLSDPCRSDSDYIDKRPIPTTSSSQVPIPVPDDDVEFLSDAQLSELDEQKGNIPIPIPDDGVDEGDFLSDAYLSDPEPEPHLPPPSKPQTEPEQEQEPEQELAKSDPLPSQFPYTQEILRHDEIPISVDPDSDSEPEESRIRPQIGSASYERLTYCVRMFICKKKPNHCASLVDILQHKRFEKYVQYVVDYDRPKMSKKFGPFIIKPRVSAAASTSTPSPPLTQEARVTILTQIVQDLLDTGFIKPADSLPHGGTNVYEGLGRWNLSKPIASVISNQPKSITLNHVMGVVAQNKQLRGHFVAPRLVSEVVDEMLGEDGSVWSVNRREHRWVNKGSGF